MRGSAIEKVIEFLVQLGVIESGFVELSVNTIVRGRGRDLRTRSQLRKNYKDCSYKNAPVLQNQNSTDQYNCNYINLSSSNSISRNDE